MVVALLSNLIIIFYFKMIFKADQISLMIMMAKSFISLIIKILIIQELNNFILKMQYFLLYFLFQYHISNYFIICLF